jgi:nickel-dependent lactate racemase
MNVHLAYGKETLSVEIPVQNLIGEYKPKKITGGAGEDLIIEKALENPIGSPKLADMVKAGDSAAIVVDDNTRPTPTAKIIPRILSILHDRGVEKKDITLVFANGSHRLNTREEQIKILGDEKYIREYRISDHDVHDTANLRHLGSTSRGTPVSINSYVADADIRILIGLIKPHAFAGYTGGGKSILPGVSSMETIIADHDYNATKHPRSILGVVDGNLIRSDIEEAAGLLSPCFIFNAILDDDKKIIGAVAGDMIKAHREGVKMLDEIVRVEIPEIADIVVAGCSHPTSVNLYQSVNAVINCTKIEKPIVKEGGIIILASPCPEKIGGGPFYSLVSEAPSLEKVLEKLADPKTFIHDQWAAQAWATALLYCDVFLVSSGISDGEAAGMKVRPFADVPAAVKDALARKGGDARITVLSDAPYVIPYLTT